MTTTDQARQFECVIQTFPEEAKRLHAQLEAEYSERYQTYKEMAQSE